MAEETRKYEGKPGEHIRDILTCSVDIATREQRTVCISFNGVDFNVHPTDSLEAAKERWKEQTGWSVLDVEEEREQARTRLEETAEASRKAIADAKVQTEEKMREQKAPTPHSVAELAVYVQSLVERPHDYGTAVYAMSLAAVATFNYVGRELGVTGFQASCADIDFFRRTRHLDGPFGLIKAEDMLYPQYDQREKLEEWLKEWTPWAAEQAKKKLEEVGTQAHPAVLRRWEELASQLEPTP